MTLPQDQSIYSDQDFERDLAEFAQNNSDSGEFFEQVREDLDSNHQIENVSAEPEKLPKIKTLLEFINEKRKEEGQEQFVSIEAAIKLMKNTILEDIRGIASQFEASESQKQLEASISSNFKLKCALGVVSTLLCMSALYILYREFPIKLDLKALLTWGTKLPNNIECEKAAVIARD